MGQSSSSHRRRERPRSAKFKNIYFGLAAAENEVARDPERFRRTYFDRYDLPRIVANHERFLILGPKGTGKSAAAKFVALEWQHTLGPESVFVSDVDFDELNRTQSPLTGLDRKLVSEDLVSMTDMAWKLFLSVRLLESHLDDPRSTLYADPRAKKFLQDLVDAGLASDDYPQVLRKVRERQGTIRVPKFAAGSKKSTDSETMSVGQVGDAVLDLVSNAMSPNRHLLVIDGLDKAITTKTAYWQTLAALIRVADKVRRLCLASGSNTFVLVLCRSDVFRHTSFADAPKIAADGAVHIEWHAEASNPREVLLWEFLSMKAEVGSDELLKFLPQVVKVGPRNDRPIPTLEFILESTRYTPRDLTVFFNTLQQDLASSEAITGRNVRTAADRFATNHLLHELKSESTGLLDPAVVDGLDGIFSELPSRKFSADDLQDAISGEGLLEVISARELGEYLFAQGIVGNFDPRSGYIQFYHRRDTYQFSRKGPYMVHPSIVRAFNLPWK